MSRKGHIPIRMCIGCRKNGKKEEMIRLTKNSDGNMLINGKKNRKGRGFYLCPEFKCLKMAQKKSRIIGIDGSAIAFDQR